MPLPFAWAACDALPGWAGCLASWRGSGQRSCFVSWWTVLEESFVNLVVWGVERSARVVRVGRLTRLATATVPRRGVLRLTFARMPIEQPFYRQSPRPANLQDKCRKG